MISRSVASSGSGDPQGSGFRSILCPVDFSLPASAALEVAADVARRSGGHLTVLCVEDPLLRSGAAAAGYNTVLLRKSTLAQLRRLVERTTRPTRLSSSAWSVEALVGKPALVITRFATRMNADLIVMGTNGRRGPAKLVFGSVAEAVLRRTPVPLLVVPRSQSAQPVRGAKGRRVLGALELGPNDRNDARRMARAAKRIGGPLTLLHVVHRPDHLAPPASRFDSGHERQLKVAGKRLEHLAKSVGAASRMAIGVPEDEIAAAATGLKAGLVVLALRRGRGLFGPRQGTTTYRLLCASATPVLALPPDINA
jgi:nucleotide-binding universal stress UspA family protein